MSDEKSLREDQEIEFSPLANEDTGENPALEQPKEEILQEIRFDREPTEATESAAATQPDLNSTPELEPEDLDPLMEDNRLSNITNRVLPLSSLFAALIVIFFSYLFFSGHMYRFYASALFGFYALTKHMWISVMLLGVFQTLILVPLRIIRVIRQTNIKDFVKEVEEEESSSVQIQVVQKQFKSGNRTFLFYLIDFTIQLTTFLTIGRLFLTDFYNNFLDPARLYSFIPYPDYPILDPIFRLPYPVITKTMSLGWPVVLIVWLAILFFQLILTFVRSFLKKNRQRRQAKEAAGLTRSVHSISKYSLGYLIIALVLSWFILTHVPVGVGIRIFKGDVGIPNPTFNTVTACVTFLTLLWFSSNDIVRKSKKAIEAGVDARLVDKSQKEAFSRGFFNAAVVGLGAFFITNQIPSAFELSIFVLEVISLLSPLTLDRLIVTAVSKVKKPHAEEA